MWQLPGELGPRRMRGALSTGGGRAGAMGGADRRRARGLGGRARFPSLGQCCGVGVGGRQEESRISE